MSRRHTSLSRTLLGIKRKPSAANVLRGKLVAIWSREHLAWWRDGGAGYCRDFGAMTLADDVWVIPFERALETTRDLGPEKKIMFYEVKP